MATHSAALAEHVRSWHPGPVQEMDQLDLVRAAALSAVLGVAEPPAGDGERLPLLWHWVYFPSWDPPAGLGPDGHPLRGHFLPPVPDRRRMWAGGRIEQHEPLVVGEPAVRTQELARVRPVSGHSGDLLFVTTRATFTQQQRVRIVEETDLVYRSGEPPGRTDPALSRAPAPASAQPWSVRLTPDAVLLFRFSALTANSHRIHYDQPYATQEEGYPGLVVHGPLLALLMAEVLRSGQPRPLASFSYRLMAPVFAGEEILAAAGPAEDDPDSAHGYVATARTDRHAEATARFR